MRKFISFIILIGLLACNQDANKSNSRVLDFGSFSIQTPTSWIKIEKQGIDSYVGQIAIDDKDTLHFDLGWYSNKLYQEIPNILDSSLINSLDTNVVDINSIIFVKDGSHVDPDKYIKNNVSWDTISGYRAKIVYPRETGIGTTGIYIDSLWKSGSGIDKFNLYGENLKPINEQALLKALKTIKFKKH